MPGEVGVGQLALFDLPPVAPLAPDKPRKRKEEPRMYTQADLDVAVAAVLAEKEAHPKAEQPAHSEIAMRMSEPPRPTVHKTTYTPEQRRPAVEKIIEFQSASIWPEGDKLAAKIIKHIHSDRLIGYCRSRIAEDYDHLYLIVETDDGYTFPIIDYQCKHESSDTRTCGKSHVGLQKRLNQWRSVEDVRRFVEWADVHLLDDDFEQRWDGSTYANLPENVWCSGWESRGIFERKDHAEIVEAKRRKQMARWENEAEEDGDDA